MIRDIIDPLTVVRTEGCPAVPGGTYGQEGTT